MERVYDNVIQAIGDTPIVRLNSISRGLSSEIYVKLEFLNPGDRDARRALEDFGEVAAILKRHGIS